jgi:hypothetical protein
MEPVLVPPDSAKSTTHRCGALAVIDSRPAARVGVAVAANPNTESPAHERRTLPWASLAGLFLLLAIVAIATTFMAEERARRLAPVEVPEVALRDYVIPPGREHAVRELLAPIEDGALPKLDQYSFSIQRSSIRVQLHDSKTESDDCSGPSWIRAPGALVLTRAPPEPAKLEAPGSGSLRHETLWLRWHWCDGETRPKRKAAVRALGKHFGEAEELDEIWQAVGAEPEPPPERPRESGILSPAAELLGLDLEQLTIAALLLGALASGLVATAFGPRLPGPSARRGPPPRWLWALAAALVLASVWLRLELAGERALDTDETWFFPLEGSIFAENHDPWVHPPLSHLVQQPWIRMLEWAPGDGLLELRGLMLAFGLLATILAIAAVTARAHRPALLVLALPCALAPRLATTLVLARPYALAAALVMICATALWPVSETEAETQLGARVRWWVILLAAGLAAWTDVIAGAAAGLLVLARLLAEPREDREFSGRAGLAKLAALTLLAVWMLPLVPGALEAAAHHVDPEVSQAQLDALGIARPADVRPDPKLTRQLPAFSVLGLARGLWPLGVLALALLAALAVLGWRGRHRVAGLLPLALLGLWLLVASFLVHLRARNVAFAPPLTALLAALVLADRQKP